MKYQRLDSRGLRWAADVNLGYIRYLVFIGFTQPTRSTLVTEIIVCNIFVDIKSG